MKKLLFLLSIILLSSCSCLLSQVPPQHLYVGDGCGAALPDYLTKINVSDNCEIDTVYQSPTRGTWLTAPTTTVLIRAIDKFSNFTDMMFTVTLLDTVPPVITVTDSTLISAVYDQINTVYNIADRMLARQEMWFDANFDWEAAAIPDSIQPTNEYANKTLLTWTDPLHAFTGEGMRVHTFVEPGDTIIIPLNY
jgi:hypothetical protein